MIRYRLGMGRKALVAASAVVAMAVAGTGLPAAAATTTTKPGTHQTTTTAPLTGFAADKAQLVTAVNLRVATLQRLVTAVNASKVLAADDRAVLLGTLTTSQAAMTALAAKVPTDTTEDQLTADRGGMVQGYRVLALQAPVTDMVLTASQATALQGQLAAGVPLIQKQLSGTGANAPPAAITTAFTDLQHQLTLAQNATVGVSSSLLSLLPGSYPGNAPVLTTAQTDLIDAHQALAAAVADVTTIYHHVHR